MAVDLHQGEAGATAARAHEPSRWELPPPLVRLVRAGWPVLWISMFVLHHWQAGLVLLLLTGPVGVAVRGTRRERRRRRRIQRSQDRAHLRALEHAAAVAAPPRAATSAAERALAAAVARAGTSGGRLDADAVELVREADGLLRPLLVHVRARGADARVRHDLESIATELLPRALDAYLVLPAGSAHAPRASTGTAAGTTPGTTPADELRSQLLLLVEGCRQLRDAVLHADLDRQQELSRFLDAKFRRSDLDL